MCKKLIAFLLVFTLLMSLIYSMPIFAANGGLELIENGGFENGLAPWQPHETATIEVIEDMDNPGSHVLFVSGRTTTGAGVQQYLTGKVEPGKTYKVSAKVKYDAETAPATRQFFMSFQDGDWQTITNMAGAMITKGEWGIIEGIYTIDPTVKDGAYATLEEPRIFIETSWTQEQDPDNDLMDFYVDDVSVIDISVQIPPTGVMLDTEILNIAEGSSAQLTATVFPEDSTNKKVIWSSSDTNVATVDSTGKVTGQSFGTATITVTTEEGGYQATCKVIVASRLPYSKVLDLKFDDNITDSSDNSINGTWHGDEATYVEGKVGKAIKFNGNNYIDLGTSSVLQPEDLTISLWVKPDSVLSGEHMIAWFKPDGNWQGEGWYLSCLDNTTPLKLSTGTGVQESYVEGNRNEFFPVGEWTHIVVTYDSATRDVTIYRNGISQQVLYNKRAGSITANDRDHKYIGFNSPGYGGGYARLNMDELKIYNVAATSSEIRELYQAEGGILNEDEIAQMDLDAISLPSETRADLIFPTKGQNGSIITWESSNPDVISNNGVVTIQEEDVDVTIHVTVKFGEAIKRKDITVTVKTLKLADVEMIKQFDIGQVNITDPYYVNAFNKDLEYLLSLDPDRLLVGFKAVADGRDPANTNLSALYGTTLYGGWEDGWSLLRGHTMGHYLTALAQAYKQTKDNPILNEQIKDRLDYIVDGLKESQDKSDNGYLFASLEPHFDIIEGKAQGDTWVPWYTMHKLIQGLVDVYNYQGNETALQVARRLGDWTYNRASSWDSSTRTRVLNIEYGGINDCLYELFKVTRDPKHLEAAHLFDEDTLFTPIANGQDILRNRHANTTIPKFIGALNRYRTLGENEDFYLKAAESFWEIVIQDHTYVTGGNSQSEHFRTPGELDANRDNLNNESCNAYNMLKLSKELFKVTGDPRYADYYETTYINEIMASQNPDTGMVTYFKPMGTGYFKLYSSETRDFWCCTGTGMEIFTKLDDGIYYHSHNDLYVNMYLSSTLNWTEKGMVLSQAAQIPDSEKVVFTIDAAPSETINIKFRTPAWIAEGEKVSVKVNGETLDVEAVNGYINVNRTWAEGDIIELTLPMEVKVSRLPDNSEVVAFTYGPVVLSAGLGTERMEVEGHWASKKALIPEGVEIKEHIFIENDSVDNWLSNIKDNLVKTEGKVEFTLRNTDEDDNLKFTPYYLEHEQRYGIYFNLSALDSESYQRNILNKKNAAKIQSATIDRVQITNDQMELVHNLQGNSSSGSFGGYQYRHAHGTTTGQGWFSYDMAVDPSVTNYISTKYYSGDAGRTFNIYVDGTLIKEETIQSMTPTQFYDVRYEIPANLVEGKTKVTVKFANRGNSYVGGVFDNVFILKNYDTNPELESVKIGEKSATLTGSSYEITVPQDSTEAMVKFTPVNANALVYVEDILIDDTMERKINLLDDTTTLNIKVVAEDGVTEKAYTVNIKKEEQSSGDVYIVATTFSDNSLKGGKTFAANVQVKNIDAGNDPVLAIVALYDTNDKMVNVSYISKVIVQGEVEVLNAGFKLPADVTGHCVKVFVWGGDNIDESNMIPLSNVVSLCAQE